MAKQQGQQEAPVSGVIWGVLAVMVVGVFYAVWVVAHKAIATAYSWVRIVEFAPFLVVRSWWAGLPGIVLLVGAGIAYWRGYQKKWAKRGMMLGGVLVLAGLMGWLFAGWFGFFLGSDKGLIEWDHIFQSTLLANGFTFVVFVIPIAIVAYKTSLATNPLNHKHFAKPKDYTLHTFTDEMGKHYPHLRLFRKLNLNKKPINKGHYRMADTFKQIAIKHELLDRANGKRDEFVVNRDRAGEYFRSQMGKLWSGYNQLTTWELAIIAVLLPRIAATNPEMSDADYKVALGETDQLIREYWEAAADSYDEKKNTIKIDLKKAANIVMKYKGSAKVKRFYERHAYVSTVIYSMLMEARSLGVLAACDLRWLRVTDRKLWIIVDNVGRITAFPEVAAIYSHYLHEIKAKRPLEKPMIDGAQTALSRAIADEIAFSEDEIEAVNAKLNEKMEPAIDPNAKREKLTVFLAARVAIDRDKGQRDLFEVAVLSQTGEILYQSQCKAAVSAELLREQFNLTNEAVDKLAALPMPGDVRKDVLNAVNGHDVVMFNPADDASLFPEIERSAASVKPALNEASEFDLAGTAVNEGVIEPGEGELKTAVDAAVLVKLLWEYARKQELQASTAALKGGVDPTKR